MTNFKGGHQQYRETLASIDSELHGDDIKCLKFLCEPFVPKKVQSQFSTGLELFDALEKCKALSEYNVDVVTELLHIIGRVDLSNTLQQKAGITGKKVQHGHTVDPFYVLLFKLSEDLSVQELQTLSFLYGRVPKRDRLNMGIDLFSIMLQHASLSPTKLGGLETMLSQIDRNDLAGEIKKFKISGNFINFDEYIWPNNGNTSYQESPMECMSGNSDSICESNSYNNSSMKQGVYEESYQHHNSVQESSVVSVSESGASYTKDKDQTEVWTAGFNPSANSSVFLRLNLQQQNEKRNFVAVPPADEARTINVNEILLQAQWDEDELAHYKMESLPRGICLIIDNQKFTFNPHDESATELGERVGSDKDCEALTATFEKLHFQIKLMRNKTDVEMLRTFRDVSSSDHSQFDCFICCILSHGGEGFVFGSNGKRCEIKEIIKEFSAQKCPTLAGKPKVFFLQSCRGKEHRRGVIESDAPKVEPSDEDLLPPEADFLVGYATVADTVSYRSRSSGTFYITELTKALNKFADREDVLKILLRVNNEVSKKSFAQEDSGHRVVYKQIPAPQYTLRKILKFL